MGDDDWQTLRDLRLAALQESPHAFWAKLSDERRYTREQWTSFLGAVVWFVAGRDNGPAIGMAGLLQQDGDPELIGMWVAPAPSAAVAPGADPRRSRPDARVQGAPAVGLWVTEGNPSARTLYQRLGFEYTGEWAPLPHDAAAGRSASRPSATSTRGNLRCPPGCADGPDPAGRCPPGHRLRVDPEHQGDLSGVSNRSGLSMVTGASSSGRRAASPVGRCQLCGTDVRSACGNPRR